MALPSMLLTDETVVKWTPSKQDSLCPFQPDAHAYHGVNASVHRQKVTGKIVTEKSNKKKKEEKKVTGTKVTYYKVLFPMRKNMVYTLDDFVDLRHNFTTSNT